MIMKILQKQIQTANREQGGQALIFVTLALFVLICFFALVINVGHRVTQKVELQNAADAAAMSGGIWIARGLNMTSILNVSMTESLALIIFLKAVKKGNDILGYIYPASVTVAAGVCAASLGSACGWLTKLLSLSPAIYLNFINKSSKTNELAQKGIDSLWRVMDFIESAEAAVSKIAVLAPIRAVCIAKQNAQHDEDYPVEPVLSGFFPPSLDLPVEAVDFYDLCGPTAEETDDEKGKPNFHPGYQNFLGWEGGAMSMTWPGTSILRSIPGIGSLAKVKTAFGALWAIFPPFPDFFLVPPLPITMFGTYNLYLVDATYDSLCKSNSNPESFKIDFDTASCSQCYGSASRKNVTWDCQGIVVDDDACDANEIGSPKRIYIPPPVFGGSGWCEQEASSNVDTLNPEKNSCKRWKIEKRNSSCKQTNAAGICIEPNTCVQTNSEGDCIRYADFYYKKECVLTKCTISKEESISVEPPPNPPKPYMLKSEWLQRPDYLMVIQKKVDDQMAFIGSSRQKVLTSDDKQFIQEFGNQITDEVSFGKEGTGGRRNTWGMAQVRVYNSTKEDLFNQDWRVKLVPFDAENIDKTFFGVDLNGLFDNQLGDLINQGGTEIILH